MITDAKNPKGKTKKFKKQRTKRPLVFESLVPIIFCWSVQFFLVRIIFCRPDYAPCLRAKRHKGRLDSNKATQGSKANQLGEGFLCEAQGDLTMG